MYKLPIHKQLLITNHLTTAESSYLC